MPGQMFADVGGTAMYRVGTRKWYTLPLSVIAHLAGLAVVAVAPVIATSVLLPSPQQLLVHVAASVVSPPPIVAATRPRVFKSRAQDIRLDAPPSSAPTGFTPEPDRLPLHTGMEGGSLSMMARSSVLVAPPGPPATPMVLPEVPRVGGRIQAPRKVKDVLPVYPAVARTARARGTVIIEALIGKDGHVRDVHVLRSVPLLDAAALEAVRQWQYTPTTLNGVPTDVVMTVTVHFELN